MIERGSPGVQALMDIRESIPHTAVEAGAKREFEMHTSLLSVEGVTVPKWDDLPDSAKNYYMGQAYEVILAALEAWPGMEQRAHEEGHEDHHLHLPLAEQELEEI